LKTKQFNKLCKFKIQDSGLWIQDPAAKTLDQGPWIKHLGSCIQDPGSTMLDPVSRILDPGSWIWAPGYRPLDIKMLTFQIELRVRGRGGIFPPE